MTPAPQSTANLSDNLVSPPEKSSWYLIKHWRGDLSLARSWWMNGILVSFLVRIAVRMFVSLRIEISPKPFAALALTALIAMFAIWVWQLAGIWRSASKHV